MTERVQQYLALYRKHRFEHQRVFYESRQKEFEAARDEVIWLTAVFMVLTAGAAALAAANIGGLHVLWSILAVAFPSCSTALAAYNGLYAFRAPEQSSTAMPPTRYFAPAPIHLK